MSRKREFQKDRFIIAVDGAARLFLDKDIKVDLVITDLDGLNDDQVLKIHDKMRAAIIIHCHGDNIPRLRAIMDRALKLERCLFTTQVQPTSLVLNLGGFTDGDRALFTAIDIGFTHIFLVSMDVDAKLIGRFSKLDGPQSGERELALESHPVKQKKMHIALAILKWLAKNKPNNCFISTYNKINPFDFLPNVEVIQ